MFFYFKPRIPLLTQLRLEVPQPMFRDEMGKKKEGTYTPVYNNVFSSHPPLDTIEAGGTTTDVQSWDAKEKTRTHTHIYNNVFISHPPLRHD